MFEPESLSGFIVGGRGLKGILQVLASLQELHFGRWLFLNSPLRPLLQLKLQLSYTGKLTHSRVFTAMSV